MPARPALGPSRTPTATPGPQRVRLRVQVVDVAGQPVSEAIVEVRDRFNGIAGQQETGSTGEVIVGLKAGHAATSSSPARQGLAIGRLEGVDVLTPVVGPPAPSAAARRARRRRTGPFRGQVVQVRLGPPAAPVPAVPGAAAARRRWPAARLFVGHNSPRLSAVDASSNLLQKHSEALGQGRMTSWRLPGPTKVFAAWFSAPELLVLNAYDL